jgi:hypothetical protein
MGRIGPEGLAMSVVSWLRKVAAKKRPDLVFLNRTRTYNATKNCVTFWGFDASFEITFDLPDEELQQMCSHASGNQASVLRAFDDRREAAERLAMSAHKVSSQRHHVLRLAIV